MGGATGDAEQLHRLPKRPPVKFRIGLLLVITAQLPEPPVKYEMPGAVLKFSVELERSRIRQIFIEFDQAEKL